MLCAVVVATILTRPVTVTATLTQSVPPTRREMAAYTFRLDVDHRFSVDTFLIARSGYDDALAYLRRTIVWREPYLFVRSECGGGTISSCDEEVVFRRSARGLTWLGTFIVGDRVVEPARSYRDGFFIDYFDRLDETDGLALSDAGRPRFEIRLRDENGHLRVDINETWRANRNDYEKTVAELPGSPDGRLRRFAQAVAIAAYCGRSERVDALLLRAHRFLDRDDYAAVRLIARLVVPGALPSSWRGVSAAPERDPL